jgi:predicted nucleic acid-binding protein
VPAGKIFVDSNVVLYSLGNDAAKKFAAVTLLTCTPVLSTQVLLETANVSRSG